MAVKSMGKQTYFTVWEFSHCSLNRGYGESINTILEMPSVWSLRDSAQPFSSQKSLEMV